MIYFNQSSELLLHPIASPQVHAAGVELAYQDACQVAFDAINRDSKENKTQAQQQSGDIDKKDIHGPAKTLQNSCKNTVYVHERTNETQGPDIYSGKGLFKNNGT